MSLPAGLAGATLLTRSGQAAPPPISRSGGGLKIGLATYSMRKLPLDAVLETCKAASVRYVNLKEAHLPRNATPEETRATAARIEAAGLTIMGGGNIDLPNKGQPVREEDIRATFEYARAARMPLLVITPSLEALDVIEAMVRAYDIKVAIHNHGPEDAVFPTPLEVLGHIARRDRRMGVCMDVGHTLRAGADPAKVARRCGDRLLDLHIKDVRRNGQPPGPKKKGGWDQVEVGRGEVDIVGLFKTLRQMRFEGHVGLEYEIDADNPVAGVLASLAYMRGVAAAIG